MNNSNVTVKRGSGFLLFNCDNGVKCVIIVRYGILYFSNYIHPRTGIQIGTMKNNCVLV